MKFEKQRTAMGFPTKKELDRQDYLTFREAPSLPQTGRTILSQQLGETHDPSPLHNWPFLGRSFKKQALRNVRSQQKYPQLEEEMFSSGDENGQASSQRQRQQQLSTRLAMLTKNLRRAAKKGSLLQEEIQRTETAISINTEAIERANHDIQELTDISTDNLANCRTMTQRLHRLEEEAHRIDSQARAHQEQRNTQQLLSVRTKEGQGYPRLLQEGLQHYEQVALDLCRQIEAYEQQIRRLQGHLQHLRAVDEDLHSI